MISAHKKNEWQQVLIASMKYSSQRMGERTLKNNDDAAFQELQTLGDRSIKTTDAAAFQELQTPADRSGGT